MPAFRLRRAIASLRDCRYVRSNFFPYVAPKAFLSCAAVITGVVQQ
jgi:hypothetical protein